MVPDREPRTLAWDIQYFCCFRIDWIIKGVNKSIKWRSTVPKTRKIKHDSTYHIEKHMNARKEDIIDFHYIQMTKDIDW